jgi:hypothetical protein
MFAVVSACGADRAATPTAPPGPSAPVVRGSLQVSIKGGLSPIVVPGRTIALAATFADSDGSTRDVTESALWQSSNPAMATVTAGIVSAAAEAVVEIKATYQNVSGQTKIDIRRTCEAATSSIAPETRLLTAMEYQGRAQVKVASSTCRWVAIPEGILGDVDNPSASGDGSFSYFVGANNLAETRSGRIRVVFPDQSELVHTFIQDKPLCSYVPVPAEIVLPAPGGNVSFKLITTPETCGWTLETYEGRLGEGMTITSPRKGVGSTTVSYRISRPNDRRTTSYPVYILPAKPTSPDALHVVQVVVAGG